MFAWGTENDAPIVFIGKGITFDTGGISLKSSDKLDEMKQDMAGAASVLGAMEIIGRTGTKEAGDGNSSLLGEHAGRTGIQARRCRAVLFRADRRNHKHGCRGQAVLCDASAMPSTRFKPALDIDIATLTGACVVALGNQAAAVLGNREGLVRSIQEIGPGIGERFGPCRFGISISSRSKAMWRT